MKKLKCVEKYILENNFSFSGNELSLEVSQPDLILEMTSDAKNVNEGEVIKYNLIYVLFYQHFFD